MRGAPYQDVSLAGGSRLLCRFAEEIGGFQEGAHGGGELRGRGQDDTEEIFCRTAIGGLAFASTIKGLCPAENILFGRIAGR